MLGDAEGNGPGGFLLLDEGFEVAGRWETEANGMRFNRSREGRDARGREGVSGGGRERQASGRPGYRP
jgi:hypothetical protein